MVMPVIARTFRTNPRRFLSSYSPSTSISSASAFVFLPRLSCCETSRAQPQQVHNSPPLWPSSQVRKEAAAGKFRRIGICWVIIVTVECLDNSTKPLQWKKKKRRFVRNICMLLHQPSHYSYVCYSVVCSNVCFINSVFELHCLAWWCKKNCAEIQRIIY